MTAESARILVVGRSGQVATALQESIWPEGFVVDARGHDRLDLRQPDVVAATVAEGGWSAVINAGAYTQVDRAESEPDAAFVLNRDGPAALAEACSRGEIPLIHLSTDYVFDGEKSEPYTEDDPVKPASVYGASKVAGEEAVRTCLSQHVILRTSWVFSATGANFVKTMLRVGAERDELRIVEDQHGRPSAARDIADALVHVVTALLTGKQDEYGTFHFANAGATTWYDFASEIFRLAALRGYGPVPRLTAIPTSEFPTPAQRPMNSVLDTKRIEQVFKIQPRHWQEALGEILNTLIGPVDAQVQERTTL